MMPDWTRLDVKLDGDGAWPDLAKSGFQPGHIVGVALLRGGTAQGRSAVMVRIELDNGTAVVAQTTLRLLATAMRAIMARAGEESDR